MAISFKPLWQNKMPLVFVFLCVVLLLVYFKLASNHIVPSLQISPEAITDKTQFRKTNKQNFKVASISQQRVQARFQDFQENIPSYLQGTDIRGELLVNAQGKLFITTQIKKRFDYFYLLAGDKSQAQINDIIKGHLFLTLQEPALQTALDLLARYTRYLNEYENLIEGLTPQDANSDLMWLAEEISQLKAIHFGEEVASNFFGSEDVLRQESLRLIALNKAQAHGQAHSQETSANGLPTEVAENREKTLSFYTAKQQIKDALDKGAQAEEITVLRTQLYGEEAAKRLQKVDSQRQQWQRIVAAYHQMKSELINSGGLAKDDFNATLAHNMKRMYQVTAGQLRRLAALERIAVQGAQK